MGQTTSNMIDRYGDPLAFQLRRQRRRPSFLLDSGRDVIKIEARQMAGHQKKRE